ncbi:restriction endonuclease subunit S [Clostridioides difficile]|nr:restriction endonuclease subunit S [Clostridioides difficile]
MRQSIGYKDIRNIRIPFPPREEQDQIVRFLDWKLAKINKLIRAKKKQIALFNEQRQAIINNVVTKG